jgi:hypothetical protein
MGWSMAEGKKLLKEAQWGGRSNWDAAVVSLDHALDFLFRCYINPGEFVAQVCICLVHTALYSVLFMEGSFLVPLLFACSLLAPRASGEISYTQFRCDVS